MKSDARGVALVVLLPATAFGALLLAGLLRSTQQVFSAATILRRLESEQALYEAVWQQVHTSPRADWPNDLKPLLSLAPDCELISPSRNTSRLRTDVTEHRAQVVIQCGAVRRLVVGVTYE